jgi:hypothetical protein
MRDVLNCCSTADLPGKIRAAQSITHQSIAEQLPTNSHALTKPHRSGQCSCGFRERAFMTKAEELQRSRERALRWREANPEKYREANRRGWRRYHAAHPTAARDRMRAMRARRRNALNPPLPL